MLIVLYINLIPFDIKRTSYISGISSETRVPPRHGYCSTKTAINMVL